MEERRRQEKGRWVRERKRCRKNDIIFVPYPPRTQTSSPFVSRFPLHDSVWLVLLEQTKGADPKVFQSVALAIYYLAVDSGENYRLHVLYISAPPLSNFSG